MVQAASVGRRTGAFVIDLGVLAVGLLFSTLFLAKITLEYLVVAFVGYHTAFAWLTGSTPGKAALGLRLERLDGRAFRTRPLRLPWVLARSALGYLVIDVFGVGLIVAALLPQRRPLHDVVFQSVVVVDPASAPRLYRRLTAFETDLRESADAVRRPRNPVLRLIAWLVGGVLAVRNGVDMVRHWGARLWRRVGPDRSALRTPAPATASPLAVKAAIVATAAIINTLVWPRLPDVVWEKDEPDPGPASGLELAALRSAPVPAMCDYPAGTATDGVFNVPGGGLLAQTSIDYTGTTGLYAADGWRAASAGDLDDDGGDEAVAIVSCTTGASSAMAQAVVYDAGPAGPIVLAIVPMSDVEAVRIKDGAVEVVSRSHDRAGGDSGCCPSIIEAHRYRLNDGQLFESDPAPLDASQPLREGAWGPLRIGSSLADAALYLGQPLDIDDGLDVDAPVELSPDKSRCTFSQVTPSGEVLLFGVADRTTSLSVGDPEIRTDEGIGVGSSEEAVRAAYDGRVLAKPNMFHDLPDLYVGDPVVTVDAPALRFVRDYSTGLVTEIRVGAYADVSADVGCT